MEKITLLSSNKIEKVDKKISIAGNSSEIIGKIEKELLKH